MKNAQELLNLLAGVLGFGTLSEAVAELPRVVVKGGVMPGQLADVAIGQDREVVIAILGAPEVVVPSSLESL
jgi:hypothetical protein